MISIVPVRSVLLWACVGLLGSAGGIHAQESIPGLVMSTNPATIVVGPAATSASAQLIMRTTGDGLPSIRLQSSPLRQGDKLAYVVFPENGGLDWIELGLGADARVVAIEIRNVRGTGTYEGSIEASVPGATSLRSSTAVMVQRPNPNFGPVISGESVKENRIEFQMSGSSRSFVFFVENPVDGEIRTFEIEAYAHNRDKSGADPASNPVEMTDKGRAQDRTSGSSAEMNTLVLIPSSFSLAPGQSQPILAEVPLGWESDQFFSLIRISDSESPSLFHDFLVVLKEEPDFVWDNVWVFSLVVAGAMLSLLINNVFPPSLAKHRNKLRLRESASYINACVRASGVLKAALLAENARIKLVNRQIQFYSTTKAEQMQEVQNAIEALKSRQEVARRVSELRDMVERNSDLPIRVKVRIEKELRQAEEAMLDGELDTAKSKNESANHIRTSGEAEATLGQLRDELDKEIQELISQAREDRPEPFKSARRHLFIEKLLNNSEKSRSRIPTMSTLDLLELERNYYVCNTYINDFERAPVMDVELAKWEPHLVEYLQGNSTSNELSLILESISYGVSLDAIKQAISDEKWEIACDPPKPRLYELTELSFQYRGGHLSGVPAALRLPSYRWEFGGDTSPARTQRCWHYFTCSRRARLKRWLQSQYDERASMSQSVTLAVTAPFDPDIKSKRELAIDVVGAADRGWGAIGMQLITFLITFLIAVVLAYSVEYATVSPLDSFTSYLTPFLFGFGLDQIRDKTTPPSIQ